MSVVVTLALLRTNTHSPMVTAENPLNGKKSLNTILISNLLCWAGQHFVERIDNARS